MKREFLRASLAATLLIGLVVACGSDKRESAVPQMLRQRYETEMKMILHDLKLAEEEAMALEDRYLELEELRRKYFNRPVADIYALSIDQVSAGGFDAQIVHRASGIWCRLLVGGGGAGIPECE